MPDVAPTPMSMWRLASALVVSAKSTAMRGGLVVVKIFGCGTAPPAKVNDNSTRPPGKARWSTCWSVVAAGAEPANVMASSAIKAHAKPRQSRWRVLVIMVITPHGSSLRMRAERDARLAFHPAAVAVGNQFDEVDAIGVNSGDAAIVLPHVLIDVDAVDLLARVLDQRDHAALGTERADHVQAVQRERFQRLRRPLQVRMRSVGALLLVAGRQRGRKRVALVLVLVDERLEGLDHRQRRQWRTLFGFLLRHPVMQVLGAPGAPGQGDQRQQDQQQAQMLR